MLATGDQIGPYTIVSALGRGGMGEVYLADDTRLRRRVALKVLPADVADARASERLLREARAAARLAHANICTVFDTGEADGRRFIAMQYIEGASLAARLSRRALDVREAVAIASQAAHALTEAHRQGIVHRDIKPQNIMLSESGQAIVLDFGLAQATGLFGDQETTVAALTESGVVAGTVRYMSPEQVKGEAVDERSDIFSLGTVLYEMIAGAHPLGDGGAAEAIAAILTREPAPLDDNVPGELRRIVLKCLEKDRTRRYQTARDLAVDLDAVARALALSSSSSSVAVPVAAASTPARRRLGRSGWIAASVGLAGAAAVVVWAFIGSSPPSPAAGDFVQITNFADSAVAPSISADGTMVTFIRGSEPFMTGDQIYVRRLPNGEAKQLTNDPRPKYGPVFTPDGNRIAYTAVDRGKWNTWSVPVIGGEPTQVLPNAAGLTWIDEQRLLFSEIKGDGVHMGVVTSTASRAEKRVIYFPPHERAMAHYSVLSPDRKSILVVEMNKTGGWDPCRLVPFDGAAGARPVGPPGACQSAAWSPDGQWMYFGVFDGVTSHLWRQRFPNGTPEPLTSGPATDEQGIAVAPDGASIITSVGRQSSALWVRDSGGERLLSSEGFVLAPRMAKSGKQVFCLVRRVGSPELQLALIDIATGRTDTLLADAHLLQYDISRDEKTVAYVTSEKGERQVWLAALDKTSPPRRLVEGADNVWFSGDDELVFRALEGHANFLDRIKRDGSGRTRILDRPIVQAMGVTPDGQWALVQMPSPTAEQSGLGVYAIPLRNGEPKYLCLGICSAVWSADTRHLFLATLLNRQNRTLLVPVPRGRVFPEFPPDATAALEAWEKRVPGARWLDGTGVAAGSDPSAYVFTKRDDQRNLFRIPIR